MSAERYSLEELLAGNRRPDMDGPEPEPLPIVSQLPVDGRGLQLPAGQSIIDFDKGEIRHVESRTEFGFIEYDLGPPLGEIGDVERVRRIQQRTRSPEFEGFTSINLRPDVDIEVKLGAREFTRVQAGTQQTLHARDFDQMTIFAESPCVVYGYASASTRPPVETTFVRGAQRMSPPITNDGTQGVIPLGLMPSRLISYFRRSSGSASVYDYIVPIVRVRPYDRFRVQLENQSANSFDWAIEIASNPAFHFGYDEFYTVASGTIAGGDGTQISRTINDPAEFMRITTNPDSANTADNQNYQAQAHFQAIEP